MTMTQSQTVALNAAAVQLLAKLEASGVSMAELMNGTEKPQKAATTNGIYWVEEEFKGTTLLKICRDYQKGGDTKTDWLFNAGATKWGQLMGSDKDGDSILMTILSFLQDKSKDFVAVTKGVDAFVQKYLAFRSEYYGCDNSDLTGVVLATHEEVEQEVAQTPSILSSVEFGQLCQGKVVAEFVQDAILRDFELANVEADDYLASMGDFAQDGDVYAFLGEAGYPDAKGNLQQHAADAPRGYATKAANAWRKLAAPAPVQAKAEPALATAACAVQEVAVKTISEGTIRHYTGELSKLAIWKTGTEVSRKEMVQDVCTQILEGAKWSEVKSALVRYPSIGAYLADVSK